MIKSLRTISSTLVIVGVLMFGIGFVNTIANSSTTNACVANVIQFSANPSAPEQTITTENNQSTLQTLPATEGLTLDDAISVFQVVGTYALLIGVAFLLFLELIDAHYFKKLVTTKKRRS